MIKKFVLLRTFLKTLESVRVFKEHEFYDTILSLSIVYIP